MTTSRRAPRALGALAGLVGLAMPGIAWADVVAALPAPSAPELGAAVTGRGHTLVEAAKVTEALAKIADGTADTAEELGSVARATNAEWVLSVTAPPEGSSRVELVAYWAKSGRLESVARELSPKNQRAELEEMLSVLVRAEGVGTAELPWERRAGASAPAAGGKPGTTQVQVKAPEEPAKPEAPRVALDTPRLFAAASLGFAVAASRPEGAVGTAAAFRLAGRFGARIWAGLDVFGQLGGYWGQAGGVTVDAGARYVIPIVGGATSEADRSHGFELALAPELVAGVFVVPGASATRGDETFERPARAGFTVGGALALVARPSAALELGLSLGDVRLISLEQGSVVYAGATAQAGVRF